jgi:RNA polymerase sigma-70 factor (ECF subfamily)
MGDGDAKIPRRYRAALTCFFEANDRWLYGHACLRIKDHELAADLVQETFLAAALDWKTVRKLTEEQQRAWLCRTLAHKDVSDLRRRRTFTGKLPELFRRQQATEPDTSKQALDAVAFELVVRTIGSLSDQQKKIALMRWNDHMKLSEIAAALNIAEGTVGAHLYDIRRKLKAGLGPYYPFGPDDEEGCVS